MANGYIWRCDDCGAEEMYCTGALYGSCNNKKTLRGIRRGEFGRIAKYLLDARPDLNVVEQSVFVHCDICGYFGTQSEIYFYDQEDEACQNVRVAGVHRCPHCDDAALAPIGDWREIFRIITPEKCPKCGGTNIENTVARVD